MALPSRGSSVLMLLLLAGLALAGAFSCADAALQEGKAADPEVSDALPVELQHIDKFDGGHGGVGGGHASGGGGGQASREGGRAHSSGAGRGRAGAGARAAAAAGAATGNRRRSATAGASERGAWKAASAGATLAAVHIAVCR